MRRTVLVLALLLALAAGCAKKEPPAPATAAGEKKAASAATGGVLVPEAPAHGAPLRASTPKDGVVPEAPRPVLTSVADRKVPGAVSAHTPARP